MANKPNNPSLWSKAKSLAKQKFDVYPSAYANGWAAKWYKGKGGTWRKAEYGMEVPMMEEGGKPEWLLEAQLKAQGYSGDALNQKMSSMAQGGEPQNKGFQALPEYVQDKIMGAAYGGYVPEMAYGGSQQDVIDRLQRREEKLLAKGYKAVDEGREKKADRILGRAANVEDRKIRLMYNMGFGGYYDPMMFMADGGEPNGEMALGQMASVSDKMSKLLKFVRPEDNLDPWVASKLAVMDHSADAIADYMMYNPDGQQMEEDMQQMAEGGYTVTRSNDRKGKTHKVTGPDGTVKYFGDSKLGQHPKDPERKAAFYARHKKNLANNPYFRAFARETWEDGGGIPAPITSPYSREYMEALSNEYDQFYAPPRYYGKDDGYDAFYSYKRKSFPTMKQDSGPGWITTYSDGAQGFSSGDKDTPPKQRPGRKYEYVDSYVRDVENDMGIPSRILEMLKNKKSNEYKPEYRREYYKSGGYIGQDARQIDLPEAQEGWIQRAANAQLRNNELCRTFGRAEMGNGSSSGSRAKSSPQYKNAFEALSDLNNDPFFDEEIIKAAKKSRPSGVDKDMWNALNAEARRLNNSYTNKYFWGDNVDPATGRLNSKYLTDEWKGKVNIPDYYRYYNNTSIKDKKSVAAQDLFDYYSSQPGGLETFRNMVNSGYKPQQKMGGYIGQDGKRHMSNTPTWSGNAGYENGGPVVGDVMDVTPEQLEVLRQQGYQFEII